jgi:D-sedoheptulose 7-phosphate isomerase
VFAEWLRGSRLNAKDAVLVFSVGGGSLEKNVSPNLVVALQLAKQVGARVIGLVGRDGGYTAKVADACVIVPTVNPGNVTPHTEAFQAVLWHLFVAHPDLKVNQTKWESTR